MILTWGLALALSFGFRFWGTQHPDPFIVKDLVIYGLLLGPSLLLAIWILYTGFRKNPKIN